jgi:hypothetical protein
MTDFDELDQLSSKELHDRAFHYAERHLDVKFFWSLVQYLPMAEAAQGDLADSSSEIAHPAQQVSSAVDDDPGVMEALRPVYLDYLVQHPEA